MGGNSLRQRERKAKGADELVEGGWVGWGREASGALYNGAQSVVVAGFSFLSLSVRVCVRTVNDVKLPGADVACYISCVRRRSDKVDTNQL